LFSFLVTSTLVDNNALTKFGETALDLAVEHRSKALMKAIEPEFRDHFEFNGSKNPK
jgi:hypothetical protein